MNTTLYQNRPNMQNWTNLYLEPHDCRIYYVNINLRYQYGIFAAESQTLLLAKHPNRQRARRNGCFRRLHLHLLLTPLPIVHALTTDPNPPFQMRF